MRKYDWFIPLKISAFNQSLQHRFCTKSLCIFLTLRNICLEFLCWSPSDLSCPCLATRICSGSISWVSRAWGHTDIHTIRCAFNVHSCSSITNQYLWRRGPSYTYLCLSVHLSACHDITMPPLRPMLYWFKHNVPPSHMSGLTSVCLALPRYAWLYLAMPGLTSLCLALPRYAWPYLSGLLADARFTGMLNMKSSLKT